MLQRINDEETIIATFLSPTHFCLSRIRFRYAKLDVLQHSRNSILKQVANETKRTVYRLKHGLLSDYLRQQLKSPTIQMTFA
jgi:hypothetical protein